jgi:hypothetical protein
MCVRVLSWITAHPDSEPGFVVLVTQLQALVARMAAVIGEQRDGRVDSRAASARKQTLRREALAGPIAHLAQIGRMAAREEHELASIFVFKPTADTLLAFQSAARSMFAAAQEHEAVLVKHGLSASVLAQFGQMLAEFDATVTQGADGRTAHTAATRELVALTKDAGAVVRAMDARNRLRYQDDRQALEQWISVRTVLGAPLGAKDGGTAGAAGPAEPQAAPGGGTAGAAGSAEPQAAPGGGTAGAGGDVRPAA